MNEDVVLKKQIAIRVWRVVGSVAKAIRREELEPVLLRAREGGGTNAEDVAEHLLFGRSRKGVAERLLRIGAAYGLLMEDRRRYTLTEDGDRAIANRKIFVPERGAWTVWVSEDPLLPSPLLCIEAWDESNVYDAYTETRRDAKVQRSFKSLPTELHDIQGTETTPLASGDRIAVRIDKLEDQAEAVDLDGALSLTWSVQERRLRLQGKLDSRKVDSEVKAPDIPLDKVWGDLLGSEGLSEDWDRQRPALRVSFGETSENERNRMSRDLAFQKPSVHDFGEFEPLKVPGVPIAARSLDDARRWSVWRLKASIDDFATSKRYDEWREKAAEPFVEHDLKLPTRAELARSEWGSVTGRPAPRAWHLIAAADWRL